MDYITIQEASKIWGISERRITKLCNEGRIEGAKKFGWSWAIPSNAEKPNDARYKDNSNDNTPLIPDAPEIYRKWAMPNKNTFSIKPIKDLILSEKTGGTWIDPFANTNKIAEITNDLNTDYDTDYHMDALDFLKMFDDNSVDGVLYDPPYSPRQVSECYNDVGYNVTWDTTKASFWSNHKKEISRILKIGGKVITFGWNSGGIGLSYGFRKTKILLVPHGGWHNDTICTIEIKTKNTYKHLENKDIKNKKGGKEKIMKNFTEKDKKVIDWIENLPDDYWDFRTDDTSELTHSFHSYPATMIYPISRNIIKKMKEFCHIETLFDPFSGSGTVPVEGVLAGIPNIYATDLNPLSILLTRVKTKEIDKKDLDHWYEFVRKEVEKDFEDYEKNISILNDYIGKNGIDIYDRKGWGDKSLDIMLDAFNKNNIDTKIVEQIPDFKNIGYWFKPYVMLQIQLIKNVIDLIEDNNIRDFFKIAFSETIRLVSNRRNNEFKMYRMGKDKLLTFNPDVKKTFFDICESNIDKMYQFSDVIGDFKYNVNSELDDTRGLSTVPDNCVDLLITSPPYGDSRTTVAYGEFSKLSLQWVGINDNTSDLDVNRLDKHLLGGKNFNNGFEYKLDSHILQEALKNISAEDIKRAGDVFSFYDDLDLCLKECAKKSKKDSYQFWVVGNRTVKGTYLRTDEILVELAEKYNLEHITTFTRNIHNKVMPSLNSPSNKKGKKVTTMTNEFIIVLKKI